MKWRLVISASNGTCRGMIKWRMKKNDEMALAKE